MSKDIITLPDFLEVLTCNICLCTLRHPRQLTCSHAFCFDCLTAVALTAGSNTTASLHDWIFECPVCREATVVESCTPEEFCSNTPRNYRLEKMCLMASQCEDDLETTSQENFQRLRYCKYHSKNLIKYFCSTCKDVICRVCEIVDHRSHSIADLISVYGEERKKLLERLGALENAEKRLTIALNSLSFVKTKLDNCENDITTQINTVLYKKHQELDNLGESLRKRLSRSMRAKMKRLDAQKDLLEMELGMATTLRTFSQNVLSTGDPYKELSLLHHVNVAVNNCDQLKLDAEEDDSVVFTPSKYPALKESEMLGVLKVFSTYVQLCVAEGDGLVSGVVNQKQTFWVKTVDRSGQLMASGNPQLSVTINCPDKNVSHDVNIINNHDGTYTVSYIPVTPGKHHINVCIGGDPLPKSPFVVPVLAKRDYGAIKRNAQSAPLKFGQYGSRPREFKSPLGVTSTESGTLAVCDSYNHRVQVFDKHGQGLGWFGSHGAKIGLFACPSGICVLPETQKVAVSELQNNRIQIFDGLLNECQSNGRATRGLLPLKVVATYGSEGQGPTQLSCPHGICYSQIRKSILVCDKDNKRVVQLAVEDGHHIQSFHTEATSPLTLQPGYVCSWPGSNEQFVVTDSKNNCLHLFDPRTGVFPIRSLFQLEQSLGSTTLSKPRGVAVDLSENVVVSDAGNLRICVFQLDGPVVAEFPQSREGISFFNSPEDVTVLPSGDIVLTDVLNHQIVKV